MSVSRGFIRALFPFNPEMIASSLKNVPTQFDNNGVDLLPL